jgi:flavin reductase (DIM6/NTAB) family NADH-FMN oxidoreductase RutF
MKTEKIPYYAYSSELISAFPEGILMLTKHKQATNIMTIGWCLVGYMWNRPIFQALVRTSRFTYNLLEKSNNFSVNVPLNGKMKKEILFCGTHSGMKVDKIE